MPSTRTRKRHRVSEKESPLLRCSRRRNCRKRRRITNLISGRSYIIRDAIHFTNDKMEREK